MDEETQGRLQVTVHPFSMNVAGAGPNVVKKVIAGEIEFHVLMGGVLQVVPVMDGELGGHLRQEMAAKGLYAFPYDLMENGFRQIVSAQSPVTHVDDLAGYRMRVPAGRLFADLFESLGATPIAVNIDKLYASLANREVDGQENPLVVCEENKLYEVTKYVSVTNHMWSGFNLYGNLEFWNALPPDIQDIVQRNVTKFTAAQRNNVRTLNKDLETRLAQRGMIFNVADTASFRRRLSAGFY